MMQKVIEKIENEKTFVTFKKGSLQKGIKENVIDHIGVIVEKKEWGVINNLHIGSEVLMDGRYSTVL